MDNEQIEKILKETEFGYDSMAEKFSQTRKFFWRGLEFIKGYANDGDCILDFGCGNGRLLELFADKEIEYVGVDVSQKLLDLARDKYPGEKISFGKINPGQSSLAFEDNFFKAVYSIAVFHHLPKTQAQKIAQELYRVTQPGSRVIVTVWYLWQKKYAKNILQNWLRRMIGRSELDWNDCYITFRDNDGQVFRRFHHAFTKNELEKIFRKAGFRVERCDIINERNIVLVGKK
jgi:ubiquinone/menaquinone biosynthesis C-methylase UbiE